MAPVELLAEAKVTRRTILRRRVYRRGNAERGAMMAHQTQMGQLDTRGNKQQPTSRGNYPSYTSPIEIWPGTCETTRCPLNNSFSWVSPLRVRNVRVERSSIRNPTLRVIRSHGTRIFPKAIATRLKDCPTELKKEDASGVLKCFSCHILESISLRNSVCITGGNYCRTKSIRSLIRVAKENLTLGDVELGNCTFGVALVLVSTDLSKDSYALSLEGPHLPTAAWVFTLLIVRCATQNWAWNYPV